jgi:hypothetical protein
VKREAEEDWGRMDTPFVLAWPVLSIILAIQIALGLLIGFVEGWPVGDAIHFTFVTGLSIGYGECGRLTTRSHAR